MAKADKIIYTKTDEAPMLATYSFLPIIKRLHEGGGCHGGIAGYFIGRTRHCGLSGIFDTGTEAT